MPFPPVVSTSELASLGPLRLVYVLDGNDTPDGVICVPIMRWIDAAKTTLSGLDDFDFWQREIDALGIGTDAVSVVFDDGQMTEAARVWFILQYFGLPVVVLNGGRQTLGHPPPQAAGQARPAPLKPGSGKVGLTDRITLKGNLNDVQVFDARSSAEFRGDDLKGNSRGGHLPGATHLPHDALLNGTFLRPASELVQILDQAGIDGSRHIITHCNGGGRAALAALAAVVAGQERVQVYYLSFADWAADETCLIATGT